jgi:hypothetical protein
MKNYVITLKDGINMASVPVDVIHKKLKKWTTNDLGIGQSSGRIILYFDDDTTLTPYERNYLNQWGKVKGVESMSDMGNPDYKVRIRGGININAVSVGLIQNSLAHKTGVTTEVVRNYKDRSLDVYFEVPVTLDKKQETYLSFWGEVKKVEATETVN